MAADRTPNDLADLLARAERLIDGYPEDVFPPLTHPVRDVVLSSGEHVPVDRVSAHELRTVAVPVIADLVAALRVQAEQFDTLRNAIGDPEELRLLSNWHAMECADMHGAGGGYDGCCSEAHRAIYLRGIYEAAADALAAAGGGVPEEGATDE